MRSIEEQIKMQIGKEPIRRELMRCARPRCAASAFRASRRSATPFSASPTPMLYHPIHTSSRAAASSSSSSSSESEPPHASEWANLSGRDKFIAYGKTITSAGIVVGGLMIIGGLAYAMFDELFSSSSPSGLHTRLINDISQNATVKYQLGEPIKGFGDSSRSRKRMQYVLQKEEDGQEYMFMRTHVAGPKGEAAIAAKLKQTKPKQWEYVKLVMDVPGIGMPGNQRTVLLQN